jgi:transcriptional regulator with XRE-family HTH domain
VINFEIKLLMLQRHLTYGDFAEKLGVSRKTIAVVVCGQQKSKRVQAGIAEMLGKTVQELWPDQGKAGDPQQCVNE